MGLQKDSYFFRHDSNAKDDPKISFLIEKELEYCNIIKKRIQNLPKYQFSGELF
jgi:DNA modification methylase